MIDSTTIESLSEKILGNLPKGGKAFADDVKKNLKVAVSSALERMDLVTREEFDVQTELLARTRARLEILETQVRSIEEARASES